jgi:hypothetical protein
METKDRIIDCPKSGKDLCYEIEVAPNIKHYNSLSCGFWTNSLMKEGTEFYNEQVKILPELYKDLLWEDPETNLVWVPNTINLKDKGMIYAFGDKDNWKWAAVLAVPIGEEEKTKYPIPGKKDEYYSWRMDSSTTKYFDENDYIEALSYIKVLPE